MNLLDSDKAHREIKELGRLIQINEHFEIYVFSKPLYAISKDLGINTILLEDKYNIVRNEIKAMVSAAGFEPTTPGFIPLRFSPPVIRIYDRLWSGLSLHLRKNL